MSKHFVDDAAEHDDGFQGSLKKFFRLTRWDFARVELGTDERLLTADFSKVEQWIWSAARFAARHRGSLS